ncbi:MAG: hypothetical protein L3K08_02790, partial [Thermoplasmata archaeon]|nr:hypothetical protein [Thermoplasmata archaeon]
AETSLTLVAFSPTPSAIALGASAILGVSVAGGSGGLTYSYSALPPGCLTADTPTLPCTPAALGKFPIAVEVVDSVGQSLNASTVLTVTAAPLGEHSVGTSASGLTGTDGVLIGVALGITAVVVGSVGFWLGRRRIGPPPPPE